MYVVHIEALHQISKLLSHLEAYTDMYSGFLPSIFSFFLQFLAHLLHFLLVPIYSHLCEETQQSPLCIQLWSLYFRILCLISKGSSRHIGHIIVFIRVLKDTNLHSHSRHICQFTYIPKQVQIYLNMSTNLMCTRIIGIYIICVYLLLTPPPCVSVIDLLT